LQQEYVTKGYDRAIGIAKADSRPQLFASSNFQFQKQRDEFNPAKGDWSKSWSASLILSFPIFDGFTNSGRVRQARVDFEQSKYLQQQIEENVALAVRSAYASWQESVASLKTQEKTIEQAAEGLRIANLRYQSGVGTQLEVLSAQTASTQAKVNYINAVYDFELAVAGFVKAAGYKPEILGDEDE